jgi:hypothetical protein
MPTPPKNISSSTGLHGLVDLRARAGGEPDDRGDRGEEEAAGDRVGNVVFREQLDARLISVPISSTSTAASNEVTASSLIPGL